MATMTKAPDYYAYGSVSYSGEIWSDWIAWSTGIQTEAWMAASGSNTGSAAYRVDFPGAQALYSSVNLELQLKNVQTSHVRPSISPATVRCTLYNGDAVGSIAEILGTLTFDVDGTPGTMDPVTHRFSFPGLSATSDCVTVLLEVISDRGDVAFTEPIFTVNYTAPSLSFTLAPSSVYVGDNVTLDFTNRLGQAVALEFKYSNTLLEAITATNDREIVTCPETWFDTAAASGTSMRVNVSASDALGRTASGSFTLIRPEGSAATPIAPRSTRLDGTQPINFAWSVSDTWGEATGSALEWSTDNAVWSPLASIADGATTWTAPALKFPAGTVYWRVRARNEYGIWGAWSNGVSWTVEYSAVSQVEPVDSPTSGVINASVDRTFSVVLTASGAVYAPFTVASATMHWRSGTGGAWTDVSMTPDGSRASCVIPAGTFPSGTVQWYAEATDNTGRTTETAVYTLSTLSTDVEAVPLSPVNTVESGNGVITFRWRYGSISGEPQGGVQIETSADGETFSLLATISGADARSYDAPISTFSAGVVYWRTRAATQNSSYGPWSSVVSFVCYSAPVVSGVMADSAPWATVTWQTEGQLAYEIEIDGVSYGPYFGADVRSHTLREPLHDGLHTVRVRAQNKYTLWSEWTAAAFETANTSTEDLRLSVETDVDAALSWTGGISPRPPVITVQPVSMVGQAWSWASFAVDADGDGLSYQWYKQEDYDAPWVSLGTDGADKVLWIYCTSDMAGWKYRCVVSNGAGSDTSDAASWTFGVPTEAPVITVQPVTVYRISGTVEFVCGANGSAYQWYRRSIYGGGSDDIEATDGRTLWYLLYGAGSAGDIEATDGSDVWHIPTGAGNAGDLVAEDGQGGAWHLPRSSSPTDWKAIAGETSPILRFEASALRDGDQYFCRVSNSLDSVDSDIVQYVYAEELRPGAPGNYYIYRDGELLARSVPPAYTDRTALGAHRYRVLNRLSNNMYQISNEVTVTLEIDTLMIAPLEGGAWLRLCLSDRAERSFAYDYAGQVTYTRYCGMRYPEAEIGEGEDLTGSFDVCWTEEEIESAKAFMALLRRPVVIKAPHDMVLEGVLQGFRRNDPLFYLRYEFTVRQMDWRALDDA